ncbi:hypothetical protein HPP92_028468 [Vanilla planifolia]|uniref:Uncharacterized protein n=1 Tax=Vanilla planifolia TaxID=51239 RepID=A0A835U3N3_VANPL|nr:hypothetical protein HPP92_028468 [Vanilla planifolia]
MENSVEEHRVWGHGHTGALLAGGAAATAAAYGAHHMTHGQHSGYQAYGHQDDGIKIKFISKIFTLVEDFKIVPSLLLFFSSAGICKQPSFQ